MRLSHDMPRMTPEALQRVTDALAPACSGYMCESSSASLRKRNTRGIVTVHLQCEGCGRSLGGAMKRDQHYFWQSYEDWDENIIEEHRNYVNQESATHLAGWDAKFAAQKQISEQVAKERSEWYSRVFLTTPEWRHARDRVMWRSRGICEACLDNPAQDVHHITYAMGKLPPAWELKAVCRACHKRLHAWKETEDHDTSV